MNKQWILILKATSVFITLTLDKQSNLLKLKVTQRIALNFKIGCLLISLRLSIKFKLTNLLNLEKINYLFKFMSNRRLRTKTKISICQNQRSQYQDTCRRDKEIRMLKVLKKNMNHSTSCKALRRRKLLLTSKCSGLLLKLRKPPESYTSNLTKATIR